MSDLFPDAANRERIDNLLTQKLSQGRHRVNQGSVVPTFDIEKFQVELAAFDFRKPCSNEEVLDWIVQQMETGLVHVAHPRYFGLFNPTPTFPSQCADRIAAVFNPQLATATTSPSAVAIEEHVIRAVAHRLGLPPDATGHFTTGGAEANYTALLLALTRACPEFGSEGARAFSGRPTFYVSRDSHLAWLKIAHQAGVGRAAVRLIATDARGQLDVEALTEAVEDDQANGLEPVMIAATAGTTNAGMIDPIRACVALAASKRLWLHVDAAWGGGIIASDKLGSALDGIDQADSVTVDAHKWFATTMGCGMFITRWPALLSSAFHVSTGYMPSNLANDPYVRSIQWSRRFLGLRLFLSLATAGWEGHAEHVERTLSLGEQLKQQLASSGWRIVNDSRLGVVCIEPPAPQDVRTIVGRVLASGRAWVSVAIFGGREIIRACVTSGETTEGDIVELVMCLNQAVSEEVGK